MILNMLKNFLESSTIHGLVFISTETRLARCFWILVVITGFSIASVLIYQSFDNWAESPIKTTVETKPISELRFPKVTVCPPKNTFTDLNYDLLVLGNKTMTNERKRDFIDIVMSEFNVPHSDALKEDNKWYNVYHGYSKLLIPSFKDSSTNYKLETSASSGRVKTQYFGEKYDPNNIQIDKGSSYSVVIRFPQSVKNNSDYTLTLEVEQLNMNVSGISQDLEIFNGSSWIRPRAVKGVFNITGPKGKIEVKLNSVISEEDIAKSIYLESMPGFSVKWKWNKKVEYAGFRKSSESGFQLRR